jgi:hypothetical protein
MLLVINAIEHWEQYQKDQYPSQLKFAFIKQLYEQS